MLASVPIATAVVREMRIPPRLTVACDSDSNGMQERSWPADM
jgi:hypothetical protein